MARIRTIKPEFWTDETIVQLPYVARLFFIGLWNFCDDYGFFPDKPEQLRIFVFPCEDDIDASTIIDLLMAADLIERYFDEGTDSTYLKIKSFGQHQKVDNPTKSKIIATNFKKVNIPNSARQGVAAKYGCLPGENKAAECYYCGEKGMITWWRTRKGKPSNWISFSLELDHLVAESKDGANHANNIILSCRKCNRSKGTKNAFEWLLTPFKYETNPSLARFREGLREVDSTRSGKEGIVKDMEGSVGAPDGGETTKKNDDETPPEQPPAEEKPPGSAPPPAKNFSYCVMPWETESFKEAWDTWKVYKKQQHRFTYKGNHSEQAALVELSELSDGLEETALLIIRQSIANGWSGLFKLKADKNGKPTTGNGQQSGGLNAAYKAELAQRMAATSGGSSVNGS